MRTVLDEINFLQARIAKGEDRVEYILKGLEFHLVSKYGFQTKEDSDYLLVCKKGDSFVRLKDLGDKILFEVEHENKRFKRTVGKTFSPLHSAYNKVFEIIHAANLERDEQDEADYKKGQPVSTSTLKEIASEYNQFPKEFHGIKKGSLVFIMKHGDLDAALKGMGVLARVSFEMMFDKSVMVVKSDKPLPEGHVFVGLPRLKGYANAYIHVSQGGTIVIGSMSSHLEK